MLRTLPPGKEIRRIVVPGKQAAVNAFVMGKSIAEIAQDTASHKLRIEQVLREALIGLAALVKASSENPAVHPQDPDIDGDGRDGNPNSPLVELAHAQGIVTEEQTV